MGHTKLGSRASNLARFMSNDPRFTEVEAPQVTADRIARGFFRTETDPVSLRKATRRWLMGIVWSVLLVPAIFYLEFHEVGALGWGMTVFVATYCLLSAIGLHYLIKPEYHTPVRAQSDLLDRIGAFWLIACAFGPFVGWVITSGVFLSSSNWRWLYYCRAILSIVLPVLTALPF